MGQPETTTKLNIRTAEPKHASILKTLSKKIDGQNPFTVRTDSEEIGTLEMVAGWLLHIQDNPQQTLLLAYDDTTPVGYLIAQAPNYNRIKHTCTFMLGVLKEHHRRGIGTALLNSAEQWAKSKGITRLEMTVMDGHTAALKLYQKQGYHLESTKQNAFKLEDGTYKDELILVKFI